MGALVYVFLLWPVRLHLEQRGDFLGALGRLPRCGHIVLLCPCPRQIKHNRLLLAGCSYGAFSWLVVGRPAGLFFDGAPKLSEHCETLCAWFVGPKCCLCAIDEPAESPDNSLSDNPMPSRTIATGSAMLSHFLAAPWQEYMHPHCCHQV